MQKFKSALPVIEHHILVLLIGAAIGSYFTLTVANQESAKTQAAVRDALKAVPVAQVEPASK
jgi:gas vesicle protein